MNVRMLQKSHRGLEAKYGKAIGFRLIGRRGKVKIYQILTSSGRTYDFHSTS